MKAIVCLGKYAKNPYCFEKLGILVYSMEELSYCLKENAFLLGTEIMNDAMLQFIGIEFHFQGIVIVFTDINIIYVLIVKVV